MERKHFVSSRAGRIAFAQHQIAVRDIGYCCDSSSSNRNRHRPINSFKKVGCEMRILQQDVVHSGSTVLVVDDHQLMSWGLQRLIEDQAPRLRVVGTASSWTDAVEKCNALLPDLVLLKLELQERSTLDLLPALLMNGRTKVLLLTDRQDHAIVDLAVRAGALGVLHRDTPVHEVVKAIDRTAKGELWLDREASSRLLKQLLVPTAETELDPEQERQASLTAREREVVRKVIECSGGTNRFIAASLFISEATLRNHLTSIYNKLGVTSRLELYVYAQQQGLVRVVHDAKPVERGSRRAMAR